MKYVHFYELIFNRACANCNKKFFLNLVVNRTGNYTRKDKPNIVKIKKYIGDIVTSFALHWSKK